jgi:hypothetical protein
VEEEPGAVDEVEWRLTVELDGVLEEVNAVIADLAARLPERARLTRDGLTARVYSYGEADAARVEAIALALVERTGLGYELWHDRWDEEEEDWEEIAPDLPPGEEPADLSWLGERPEPSEVGGEEEAVAEPLADGPPAGGFPGAVTSLREAGALVLLRFPDRDSGNELRASLVEAGIPLVSRRRGFAVPAVDAAAATGLAERLRAQVPEGTSIETTTVPGRRHG